MELKSCKVYDSVSDYVKDEDRDSFLYSEEEINLLSSYGFILAWDLEPIIIEDSSRYLRRVNK